jgi:vacuolar protein sorting-associated protein 54
MESRVRILSKKVGDTDWGSESPDDVRKYMNDLAKDTGTLYKVLSKHLPDRAVGLVMVPVFTSYKDQLAKAFKDADPETETGRDW